MPESENIRGFVVRENKQSKDKSRGVAQVEALTEEKWSSEFYVGGETGIVEIDVTFSSLNYKDALCSTGHPGVAASLPMIPGVDAAGVVVGGDSDRFQRGRNVMVFHADFGTKVSGGYCSRIRVPDDFVYAIPDPLSDRDAMIYGTAGFTAAQSVERIVCGGYNPEDGPVLVTGATGGVGSMAVMMLNKCNIPVTALTGKPEREDWLREIGATQILSRDALPDASKRPLGRSQFGGAVDTVGGRVLANVLSAVSVGSTVTACGLVAGIEVATSVYPFILRGVTLAGIDSANIDRAERERVWDLVAGDYRIDDIDRIATEVELNELPEYIKTILAGKCAGRTIVKI